jgi:succinate-semialdehyde dehydrogenase / glutarate-semialdehyde dehydrogenase
MHSELFLNGEWRSTSTQFAVHNPATGAVLAMVSDAGHDELEAALSAAKTAFARWRLSLAQEREQLLKRMAALMLLHEHALAQLISSESGKPMAESAAEVRYAASFLEWFAGEARRVQGELQTSNAEGRQLLNRKVPVGVVAAITPWNFPAAMVARKLGAALASGCVMLLKPSELTPLTALALADIAQQAGVPAGVFQVLPMSNASLFGDTVTRDNRVNKITFTGSTEVGLMLHQQAAAQLKRVSLELGGNAPAIVFADADLAQAARAIAAAKMRNAGQTCVCVNRILVHSSVAQPFVALLKAELAALRVGPASEVTSAIGPLIRPCDVTRLQRWVDEAIAQGAICQYQSPVPDPVRYFPVTLLTKTSMQMTLCQREQFGPVASVMTFADEAQAVALADTGRGGLAAYLFSQNTALCWRVADALDAGMVGINDTAISDASIPFGGVGLSGIGREGSGYGLDDYLEIKHLCWRW